MAKREQHGMVQGVCRAPDGRVLRFIWDLVDFLPEGYEVLDKTVPEHLSKEGKRMRYYNEYGDLRNQMYGLIRVTNYRSKELDLPISLFNYKRYEAITTVPTQESGVSPSYLKDNGEWEQY